MTQVPLVDKTPDPAVIGAVKAAIARQDFAQAAQILSDTHADFPNFIPVMKIGLQIALHNGNSAKPRYTPIAGLARLD